MTVNTTGYKAAVCIFLYGGNESYNMIVPQAGAKYNQYAVARQGLAIPAASLLPLNGTASDGVAYGMHPNCPNMTALFNAGKGAVICNVGTLVQPTTAAQFLANTATLPPQLFSHVDQQREWMTSYVNGGASFGWAGRLADQYAAEGYTPNLTMVMGCGNGGNQSSWGIGQQTSAYVLSPNGATPIDAIAGGGSLATAVNALYAQGAADSNFFAQQFSSVSASAIAKLSRVQATIAAAGTFTTATFGIDDLNTQFEVVAKMIKAHATLGDARQMFFIGMNGFDTHNGELATLASNYTELDTVIQQFYNALTETGLQNDVVFYTNSDFSRSLVPNNDGSDHGWGGHSMVFGDPVSGHGGYYGTMPSYVIGGPDDCGQGRICPTTATEVYANTIARWIGADSALSTTLFPNLPNFSPQYLGFLG